MKTLIPVALLVFSCSTSYATTVIFYGGSGKYPNTPYVYFKSSTNNVGASTNSPGSGGAKSPLIQPCSKSGTLSNPLAFLANRNLMWSYTTGVEWYNFGNTSSYDITPVKNLCNSNIVTLDTGSVLGYMMRQDPYTGAKTTLANCATAAGVVIDNTKNNSMRARVTFSSPSAVSSCVITN